MAKKRGQRGGWLSLPLPVQQGGLGTVPAAGNLLFGNANMPVIPVPPPATNYSLRANNTGWVSAPECAFIQVVNSSYSTAVVNTSSNWIFAGLQGTLVTKLANSKILMLVNVAGCGRNTPVRTYGSLAIYRNGVSFHKFGFPFGYLEEDYDCSVGGLETNYLDTPNVPAGTSLNYQLWLSNVNSVGSMQVHWASNCTSTMTLIEVAG